jgi:hypothetical protein
LRKTFLENGTVDKESLATEIRLTKEYFRIREDSPEEKIADWRFIKEAIGRVVDSPEPQLIAHEPALLRMSIVGPQTKSVASTFRSLALSE